MELGLNRTSKTKMTRIRKSNRVSYENKLKAGTSMTPEQKNSFIQLLCDELDEAIEQVFIYLFIYLFISFSPL